MNHKVGLLDNKYPQSYPITANTLPIDDEAMRGAQHFVFPFTTISDCHAAMSIL